MVNNFRDGTMKLDGWSVDLKRADFVNRDEGVLPAAAADREYSGTFDGATTGGGTWSGQFFGASAPDDGNTDDVNESIMPSGVAGEFNGHFVNGHVNGAFGAVKQ